MSRLEVHARLRLALMARPRLRLGLLVSIGPPRCSRPTRSSLLPSALALALLVAHSLAALERRRALAFWVAIVGYGWVRHLAIRAITEDALDGRFPYRLQRPLLAIFDVPLQELAGWAIATYLAWWLAERLAGEGGAPASRDGAPRLRSRDGAPRLGSRDGAPRLGSRDGAPRLGSRDGAPRLGVVIAAAALALAATSWLVETAAGAAGWWRWTVAVGPELAARRAADRARRLVVRGRRLPVAVSRLDFAMPLLAGRWRWATLAVFPLHFAAHAVPQPLAPGWSFADLAHWLLLAGAIVIAAVWRGGERAFAPATSRLVAALPWAALAAIGAVAVGVELGVARDPRLLTSVVPLAGVALATYSRRAALSAAALALVLGLTHHASWLPGAVVLAAAATLSRALSQPRAPRPRRAARVTQAAAIAVGVAVLAIAVQAAAAEREGELRRGLDAALAARDQGALELALAQLLALETEFPRAPAPASFAGEILYRQGRLAEAASAFARSMQRHAHPRAARYLAVVALRRGERARAAEWAAIGLDVAPRDAELAYLAGRARGEALELPAAADAELASRLAALAFEVGDHDGARLCIATALGRWPAARRLHEQAVRVALASGDGEAARAAAAAWQRALPGDREPARLLARWAQ